MADNPNREAVEQALAALVREQGQWIARDPVRVRTLLQHTFANSPVGQSRELDAAVAAVEYGVFDILTTSTEASQVDGLITQLDRDRGLTTDEAQWAVQSWARAAGLPLLGGLAGSGGSGSGTVALPGVAGAAAGGAAAAAAAPPPQPQQPAAYEPPPTPYQAQQPQQPYQPPASPSPQPYGQQQPYQPPASPSPQPYGQQQPYQPPAPAGPPPGPTQPPGYGAQQPGAPGPGGYVPSGPPPGAPPGSVPPGSGKGGSGSQLVLIIGICALVGVLLIGAIVYFVTRGGEEAVGPGTSATSAAPATTSKRSTTTTEEEPSDDSSTTRSTRRPTSTESSTTTTAPTTTTEAPITWTMFTDPAGKFTIEFPGKYKLDTGTDTIDGQTVGTFDYVAKAKNATYEFFVEELPPNYYFPNPQSAVERFVANVTKNDAANVVFRDPSAYAGNPSMYLHTKKADSESETRAFITGNRLYAFYVVGAPDLSKADFAHFQSSLHLT